MTVLLFKMKLKQLLLAATFLIVETQGQTINYGNWTWIGGSNLSDQPGSYGVMGVPSPSNQPGARRFHSMVMDGSQKIIYLFGGDGYGSSTYGILEITISIRV